MTPMHSQTMCELIHEANYLARNSNSSIEYIRILCTSLEKLKEKVRSEDQQRLEEFIEGLRLE